MSEKIILACDVYGTFLDTSAVATALQKNLGVIDSLVPSKAKGIAQEWRKYQLEYTWRLNSMAKYEPFDIVTRKALEHAAADAGAKLSSSAVEAVMEAYYKLPGFEDAASSWKELSDISGLGLWIFSNGTREMVSSALENLALTPPPTPSNTYLVDEIQRYKPAAEVYRGILEKIGKTDAPQTVYLVSSNPFDVVGARASGMNAIWVDRSGSGWTDMLGMGLGPGGRELGPTQIFGSLSEVAPYARTLV